jgi:hypothetical protein
MWLESMAKNKELTLDQKLAREAQSIVALAFRNGPIEDVHSGMECSACSGKADYSRITQAEMKQIMKHAVDKLYALLWIREYCPNVYDHVVRAGNRYTHAWDLPERSREEIEQLTRFAELLGSSTKDKSSDTNSKVGRLRRVSRTK